MPSAPLTFCPTHGACRGYIEHARERWRQRESQPIYHTKEWKRFRRTHLEANPLCARCQHEGRVVVGTVVDHVMPHRGDHTLFWRGTVQTLCLQHDYLKRGRENGLAPCPEHGRWAASVLGRLVCRDCGQPTEACPKPDRA